MNKVLLVGRHTRDPELRTTPGGMAVTRFTLAVSQNFTNKNGERGADFINCSAWGRQADNISKYCHKGSLVSAEGRIRTSSYDAQDGTKRYTTDVVIDEFQFLDSKASRGVDDGGFNNAPSSNQSTEPTSEVTPYDFADSTPTVEESNPFKDFGDKIEIDTDNDNDLPCEIGG